MPPDIPGPAQVRTDVVVGYVMNLKSSKKYLFTCKFVVTRKATPGPHYRVPLPTANAILVSPFVSYLLRLQVEITRTQGGNGSVTGDYGGLNCPGVCTVWVPANHPVTLTATPASGSLFVAWHGDCKGTQPTCVLPMTAPASADAEFVKGFTLKVTKSGTGSGVVQGAAPSHIDCGNVCSETLPAGTTVDLSETPDSGSQFDHWTACDHAPVPCQVTMDADRTIGAAFTKTSTSPGYQCTGSQMELFNNSNGDAVENGGTEPSFSTNGRTYCLISITTYHWNGGAGETPGTIGLMSEQGTLGPWQATGTSGQGGAPNVNWTVTPGSPSQPVIIDGTYACVDSSPATWSQNAQSGGQGFCTVYVEAAQNTG